MIYAIDDGGRSTLLSDFTDDEFVNAELEDFRPPSGDDRPSLDDLVDPEDVERFKAVEGVTPSDDVIVNPIGTPREPANAGDVLFDSTGEALYHAEKIRQLRGFHITRVDGGKYRVDPSPTKTEKRAMVKKEKREQLVAKRLTQREAKLPPVKEKAAKAPKAAKEKAPRAKREGSEPAARRIEGAAAMKQARTFQALVDAGKSLADIVSEFGLASVSLVRQRLQLLDLHANYQSLVEKDEISVVAGWGIALAPKNRQSEIVEQIRAGKLSGAEDIKKAGRKLRDAARA
jgi:hypothetical protein